MAMKNPNGCGSVHKLSGKRRRPYIAKKTRGREINPQTRKARQLYDVIGYYETRKEAMEALMLYNANPYNLESDHITFAEVYERWSNEHFSTISHSNVNGYKAEWDLYSAIADMRFVDVKLDHLQMVVDNSGKNTPTLFVCYLSVTVKILCVFIGFHRIANSKKPRKYKYFGGFHFFCNIFKLSF